jgi:hypothetical protein
VLAKQFINLLVLALLLLVLLARVKFLYLAAEGLIITNQQMVLMEVVVAQVDIFTILLQSFLLVL